MDRPLPPGVLFDAGAPLFLPAPDVEQWMRDTFIAERSRLYNPVHSHLQAAHIGVLWSAVPLKLRGSYKAAVAMMPSAMGGMIDKALREVQMCGWFGKMPDFLIIFDASHAAGATNRGFCLVADHELTHCGHAKDKFDVPKFVKGKPKFTMRPHDQEYFNSDVQRWGAQAVLGEEGLRAVLESSKRGEMSDRDIRQMCGTCRG